MKMKRLIVLFMLAAVIPMAAACGTVKPESTPGVTTAASIESKTEPSETQTTTTTTTSFETETETGMTETETEKMVMKIGSKVVDVTWEDNASVEELKKLAASGLTIKMSKYGGFEQVGSIGHSITSADKQTKTAPGDIVLYSGNQLVVFYGSNSWAYTRLGKINMSKKELTELLGKKDVTVTLVIQHT